MKSVCSDGYKAMALRIFNYILSKKINKEFELVLDENMFTLTFIKNDLKFYCKLLPEEINMKFSIEMEGNQLYTIANQFSDRIINDLYYGYENFR